MELQRFDARHVANALADRDAPFGAGERWLIGPDAVAAARGEIERWPGYAPTPLRRLPGLARRIGIGHLLYKDEGSRFGLGSFKALGGAYAVQRLLEERLRERHWLAVTGADMLAGRHRDILGGVTVATATDGNHGRSVAWGAQRFGCRCVIYLHEKVSSAREAAIARYGAEIRRVPGSYDDSVRACSVEAASHGWYLVADTSVDGGWRVPTLVMHGYAVLAEEALEQAADGPPIDAVFVQGGVGGLAAAVAAVCWYRLGSRRPRIVVVEPERADCIRRTVEAGRPTPVPGDADTFMACLAAGEISPAAWEILKTAADDVVTVPDEAAVATMRLLASGGDGDPPVVAGESGCAAVAGLIAAMLDPTLRAALKLRHDNAVLTIGSEGATDLDTYERTVGRPASAVEAAA